MLVGWKDDQMKIKILRMQEYLSNKRAKHWWLNESTSEVQNQTSSWSYCFEERILFYHESKTDASNRKELKYLNLAKFKKKWLSKNKFLKYSERKKTSNESLIRDSQVSNSK